MSVAPELFNQKNALICLDLIEQSLIEEHSIGMKTLDTVHSNYTSFYDNSDDSMIHKIAHGFSYHNGPEWVFLTGFFFKALNNFVKSNRSKCLNYLAN